ncbi:acyltransferase [Myxococcota bacterium]|nr:acyltransferase [Myxococcota bacterium]
MNNAERILPFDGLRGSAALLVALYHFSASSSVLDLPFVANGWLSVDLFFVLSGFVLDRRYFLRPDGCFRQFVIARTGRMLPLYFAVFGIFLVMDGYFQHQRGVEMLEIAGAALINLLLLQSFGFLDQLWFYGPSWSISAELWGNFLFFGVLFYVRSLKWIVLATIPLALIFIFAINIQTSYEFGWLRCCYGLALGVISSRCTLDTGRVMNFNRFHLGDLAAVTVLLSIFTFEFLHPIAPLLFALVISFAAVATGSILTRVFGSRPLVFLGHISFTVYMIHFFIGGRVMRFLGPVIDGRLEGTFVSYTDLKKWGGVELGTDELQGLVFVVVYLVLVIVASAIIYRWFELPAYRAWKKIGCFNPPPHPSASKGATYC